MTKKENVVGGVYNLVEKVLYKLRAKRNTRDVFFRALFGNDKKALLDLYNALNGTNYDNPDELQIMTLESAIFMTHKNDVAFMLSGIINLYEHQSTLNDNMPLRMLIYLAEEYQKIVEANIKSIYGKSRIELPTPQCVVFYNGSDIEEDEKIMRLSDSFINKEVKPAVEVVVKMININYGHNEELMRGCNLLSEYSKFFDILNVFLEEGLTRSVAITRTIEYCIECGILEDFLRKHQAEVLGMLLYDFDKKKYERTLREEGREEGREEERANTEAERARADAAEARVKEVEAEIERLRKIIEGGKR